MGASAGCCNAEPNDNKTQDVGSLSVMDPHQELPVPGETGHLPQTTINLPGAPLQLGTATAKDGGELSNPGKEFMIHLRKHPDRKLGLGICWTEPEPALSVNEVRSDGLVADWNAQHPSAMLQVGCHILAVNNITDPCEAAQEISVADVVSLRVVPPPAPPAL
mmetsp:Transcript_49578/g.118082  ORF Transcript_49578/g.118082 Transcript_49578/m.118082 type:complete len:163 (-) Transcript_49578:65-553(-)